MTWSGFFNALGGVAVVVGIIVVAGFASHGGTAAMFLALNFAGASIGFFALAAIFARLDAILSHLRRAPPEAFTDSHEIHSDAAP